MNSKRSFLLVLPAFIAGAILGGLMLHALHSGVEAGKTRSTSEIEAREALFILKRIRDGRTNELTELLETKLDSAIVTLSGAKKSTRTAYRTLQAAQQYRKTYPRTPKNASEADEFVKKTLSDVEQEGQK